MSQNSPNTIKDLAQYYTIDARDYLHRFDYLWERQLHKSGRIKSFVDLLIGCECVLKAHILVSTNEPDPLKIYNKIKNLGHRIELLADESSFLEDRTEYDILKHELKYFSVFIRYSFDAYNSFFPLSFEQEDSAINYSKTIGNNLWVLNIRGILSKMIDALKETTKIAVDMNIINIFEEEEQMRTILKRQRSKCRR